MIEIKDYTTKNPLSQIGEFAGICWGAPTEDVEKNIKRAWDCIESGHDRTEEFPDIYVVIDGYSAKMMRELYTHIGGAPTRLQASTRYIDYEKKGVEVVMPHSVAKNPAAVNVWTEAIDHIREAMLSLKELGIPNEDMTNLLPLAYKSNMVWKVNLRTLVHFMHMRLCSRAYWEIREFSSELKKALAAYSPEWEATVNALFVPKCEAFGYCTEAKCCGRKPTKEDVLKAYEQYKK